MMVPAWTLIPALSLGLMLGVMLAGLLAMAQDEPR